MSGFSGVTGATGSGATAFCYGSTLTTLTLGISGASGSPANTPGTASTFYSAKAQSTVPVASSLNLGGNGVYVGIDPFLAPPQVQWFGPGATGVSSGSNAEAEADLFLSQTFILSGVTGGTGSFAGKTQYIGNFTGLAATGPYVVSGFATPGYNGSFNFLSAAAPTGATGP